MPLFLSLVAAIGVSVAALFSGTQERNHQSSFDTEHVSRVQASVEGLQGAQEASTAVDTKTEVSAQSLTKAPNTRTVTGTSARTKAQKNDDIDSSSYDFSAIGSLSTVFDVSDNAEAVQLADASVDTSAEVSGDIRVDRE